MPRAATHRPAMSMSSFSAVSRKAGLEARARSMPAASCSATGAATRLAEFLAQEARRLGHRLQLAEGGLARQELHAAVGREDHALRRDELERALDARDHRLRRLDLLVRKVDAADHDLLSRQPGQHRAVELRLGGLDRDL